MQLAINRNSICKQMLWISWMLFIFYNSSLSQDAYQGRTGTMDKKNLLNHGYYVVKEEDPSWANWSSRDYMILVDSSGFFKWFKPNRSLIKFHEDAQAMASAEVIKSEAPEVEVKTMDMSDTSATQGKLKAQPRDPKDPRIRYVENLDQAMKRVGSDSRRKKVYNSKTAMKGMIKDDRVKGVEYIWLD